MTFYKSYLRGAFIAAALPIIGGFIGVIIDQGFSMQSDAVGLGILAGILTSFIIALGKVADPQGQHTASLLGLATPNILLIGAAAALAYL